MTGKTEVVSTTHNGTETESESELSHVMDNGPAQSDQSAATPAPRKADDTMRSPDAHSAHLSDMDRERLQAPPLEEPRSEPASANVIGSQPIILFPFSEEASLEEPRSEPASANVIGSQPTILFPFSEEASKALYKEIRDSKAPNKDLVAKYIAENANIMYGEGREGGQTTLHYCVQRGLLDILDVLLKTPHSMNLQVGGVFGMTPIVQLLFDFSHDPEFMRAMGAKFTQRFREHPEEQPTDW